MPCQILKHIKHKTRIITVRQRRRTPTTNFLIFPPLCLPPDSCTCLVSANVSRSESFSGNGGSPSPPTMPLPTVESADELGLAPPVPARDEGDDRGGVEAPSSSPAFPSTSSFLSLETLSCESFFDPGSSTIPFAYPPKKEGNQISCP